MPKNKTFIAEEKSKLRLEALELREALSSHDVRHTSRKISDQLENILDWSKIESLHTYMAIASKNEIDLSLFLHWIWVNHSHIKTYTSEYLGDRKLQHIEINADTKFVNDFLGIPIPEDGTPSACNQFDVVLVPCLMTDGDKNRIGYGGGTYDAFMASQADTKSIGVGYSFLQTSNMPVEEHDQKLDLIVTS